MKLQNIILEARKNPQSNPKISINSQIEQHYKNAPVLKYGIKNSFVSFSKLEMLAGGNDVTTRNPFGVYCYPSYFVLKSTVEGGTVEDGATNIGSTDDGPSVQKMKGIEAGGREPYANIFSISGNILYIDQMTNEEYDTQIAALRKLLTSQYPNYPTLQDSLTRFMELAKTEAHRSTFAGGQLWYVMWKLSDLIATETKKSTGPVIWTGLFRRLGIDAVVDFRAAIIGHYYRSRAIVFNKQIITNIVNVDNKYSPNAIKKSEAKGKMITDTISNIGNATLNQIIHAYYGGKKDIVKYVTDPEMLNDIASYLPDSLRYFKNPTPTNLKHAVKTDIKKLIYFLKENPSFKRLATEEMIIEILRYRQSIRRPRDWRTEGLSELYELCNNFPHYVNMVITFLQIDKGIVFHALKKDHYFSDEQKLAVKRYIREHNIEEPSKY